MLYGSHLNLASFAGWGFPTPHRRTFATGILPSLAANAGSRGMDNPFLTFVQQERLMREYQV